jgi:hypothetical protein
MLVSSSIFAQASGGQIRRPQNLEDKHQQKRQNVQKKERLYPQRDEVFKSNISLPIKDSFDKGNLSIIYTLLPAPDFNGHLLERNSIHEHIKLTQVSCKQNNITDDEKWFVENKLYNNHEDLYSGPFEMPKIRERINTGGYHVLLIGNNYRYTSKVIVTDENEKFIYVAYDFENFRYAPKRDKSSEFTDQSVVDVIIEGNIMFVSHSGGYAKEEGNQTGYITAIDMLTDEIIWTSNPLTNNSCFAVVGNSIISGYGFTEEPDYLFVLDKYSGQRIQKISLKKSAEYIIIKERHVYVRTYSYDYIFEMH